MDVPPYSAKFADWLAKISQSERWNPPLRAVDLLARFPLASRLGLHTSLVHRGRVSDICIAFVDSITQAWGHVTAAAMDRHFLPGALGRPCPVTAFKGFLSLSYSFDFSMFSLIYHSGAVLA
jgi:hypothetical protein